MNRFKVLEIDSKSIISIYKDKYLISLGQLLSYLSTCVNPVSKYDHRSPLFVFPPICISTVSLCPSNFRYKSAFFSNLFTSLKLHVQYAIEYYQNMKSAHITSFLAHSESI